MVQVDRDIGTGLLTAPWGPKNGAKPLNKAPARVLFRQLHHRPFFNQEAKLVFDPCRVSLVIRLQYALDIL